MKPAKFTISETDEYLTSHSGLALIGQLIERSELRNAVQTNSPKLRSDRLSTADALTAMIGLLCLAKPDFAPIENFRDDLFFKKALGLDRVPSEATFRQRLDGIGLTVANEILSASARLLKRSGATLTPVFKDFVVIDADVSPFDNSGTKKEGVQCTYKLVDGYAPMFAYIGKEGYLLHTELREGSQHCQNGTPQFLEQCFVLARSITEAKLLIRMDAGNDDAENMKVCDRAKVKYIIKRNLRKESREEWLEEAQSFGEWREPRPGKKVYVGDTTRERDGKQIRVVYQVIERTIDRKGQSLLIPEIEVDTYWTSLGVRVATPDEVIALYRDHGTSEQFHSELKSDMDLERLPSGKFSTNGLILTLAVLAYNILRLMGQTAITNGYQPRKTVKRRRIRTVIQDLMYMAARFTKHAHQFGLALSRYNPLREIWSFLYKVSSYA